MMDEREDRNTDPTLAQVINVIRKSAGLARDPIDAQTWIERDLHICGDDGTELLADCERAFNVAALFKLADNRGTHHSAMTGDKNTLFCHSQDSSAMATS
jgi:hypothetical protein